ncbi:hypothetical protein LINPERHAP1_LOCUS10200 [Linum perenne]
MSRTDWLVPIDSFHPHEQNPSFNFTIESLVKKNRRKNHPIAIRVHPLVKMPNWSLARLIGPANFSVVANCPGCCERLTSVRFKSRNGFSGRPTRYFKWVG